MNFKLSWSKNAWTVQGPARIYRVGIGLAQAVLVKHNLINIFICRIFCNLNMFIWLSIVLWQIFNSSMKTTDCGVSSIVADDAQKPVWSAHILSIWSREGDAKLTVRMGGGGVDPSPNLPVPRWVIRYTSLQCINAVCKYFLLEAQETLHYFTNYTFKHAKLLSLGNQYVRHPMIYIKWRLAYSREK